MRTIGSESVRSFYINIGRPWIESFQNFANFFNIFLPDNIANIGKKRLRRGISVFFLKLSFYRTQVVIKKLSNDSSLFVLKRSLSEIIIIWGKTLSIWTKQVVILWLFNDDMRARGKRNHTLRVLIETKLRKKLKSVWFLHFYFR